MTDVQTLQIVDDIRALMARYVRFADHKQWSDLAGLFTTDGVFTPRDVEGAILITMTGRDQISSILTASVGEAQPIHHLFSYEVDVASDTSATGVFAMEDLVVNAEGAEIAEDSESPIKPFKTLRGYGHYHGTYINIDGTWYIQALNQTRLRLEMTY
jgi:hypothetical protein